MNTPGVSSLCSPGYGPTFGSSTGCGHCHHCARNTVFADEQKVPSGGENSSLLMQVGDGVRTARNRGAIVHELNAASESRGKREHSLKMSVAEDNWKFSRCNSVRVNVARETASLVLNRGYEGWYEWGNFPYRESRSSIQSSLMCCRSAISLGSASHGIGPSISSVRACWAMRLPGLDRSEISSSTGDERTQTRRYSVGAQISSHARHVRLAPSRSLRYCNQDE